MSVTHPVSSRILCNRDAIKRIAAKHGVLTIRVFGSVARGDDDESSDIDFLITVGNNLSPWFPGGLINELEEMLHCRVDITTEDALHPLLRDRILAEAVAL